MGGADEWKCLRAMLFSAQLGVHFSWRGASSDGSVLALDASRNKADTYTLNVPKADLVVGRTYTFRLEASLAGNPLVAASASAEFFVDSQPLVVVVQGGDTLTGEGSPVTLNASMSIDPDGKEGEIAFTWRCFVAAATSEECRHVNGTALAPVLRGPVVALLLEGTVPARSYTFIVAGRKGARLTEVSTRVSIITGMPPVAEIEPLTTKVNPGEKLRLVSKVAYVDIPSLGYEWTVIPERSTHALDLAADPDVLACASRFQANLALREHVLEPGGAYTFQLAARDAIGLGSVELTVEVNRPPSGGRVLANPNKGLAYVQNFQLAAPDWFDEDMPLWYQFGSSVLTSSGGGLKPVVLLDYVPLAGPAFAVETILPMEGLAEHGFRVVVEVNVRDSLGATTQRTCNVTADPPFSADNGNSRVTVASDLASRADEALRNGDAQSTLVQVGAIVGVLDPSTGSGARALLDSGEASAAAEVSALRAELLEKVDAARDMLLPTTSSVQRVAASVEGIVAGTGMLGMEEQLQTVALIDTLVGDTLADPVAVRLTADAAQASCAGLAAVIANRNATRAGEVATLMTRMAKSMLYGSVAGEQGSEVAADELAMRVQRDLGSDPNSTLYAQPVFTEGAMVQFPAAIARQLTATPAVNSSEEGALQHEVPQEVDVDTRVVVSATDPHDPSGSAELAPAPAAVSGRVTTIVLSDAGSEEEVLIQGLSEAVVISLDLHEPAAPQAGGGPPLQGGAVRAVADPGDRVVADPGGRAVAEGRRTRRSIRRIRTLLTRIQMEEEVASSTTSQPKAQGSGASAVEVENVRVRKDKGTATLLPPARPYTPDGRVITMPVPKRNRGMKLDKKKIQAIEISPLERQSDVVRLEGGAHWPSGLAGLRREQCKQLAATRVLHHLAKVRRSRRKLPMPMKARTLLPELEPDVVEQDIAQAADIASSQQASMASDTAYGAEPQLEQETSTLGQGKPAVDADARPGDSEKESVPTASGGESRGAADGASCLRREISIDRGADRASCLRREISIDRGADGASCLSREIDIATAAALHFEEDHAAPPMPPSDFDFRTDLGTWTWSLFGEDREGEATCISLKTFRQQRSQRSQSIVYVDTTAAVRRYTRALSRPCGLAPHAQQLVAPDEEQLINGPWPKEQALSPFPVHADAWSIDEALLPQEYAELREEADNQPESIVEQAFPQPDREEFRWAVDELALSEVVVAERGEHQVDAQGLMGEVMAEEDSVVEGGAVTEAACAAVEGAGQDGKETALSLHALHQQQAQAGMVATAQEAPQDPGGGAVADPGGRAVADPGGRAVADPEGGATEVESLDESQTKKRLTRGASHNSADFGGQSTNLLSLQSGKRRKYRGRRAQTEELYVGQNISRFRAKRKVEPLERLIGTAIVMAYLEVTKTVQAAQSSTPCVLIDAASGEEAYKLWATLCVLAKCHSMSVMWVFNPEDPPEKRRTIATNAETFIRRKFSELKLPPHVLDNLIEEAASQVQQWHRDFMDVVANLRWTTQVHNNAHHSVPAKLREPPTSRREQRLERLAHIKDLIIGVLRHHPWMKISVVGRHDPFSRPHRILTQCTTLFLQLLIVLACYYSKATICCTDFREAVGCSSDPAEACRGHATCDALMNSAPFDCDAQLNCAPHAELLPNGYTCEAFPRNKVVDKIWTAVIAISTIVPVNLCLAALFIAGGTYHVPKHWVAEKRFLGKFLDQQAASHRLEQVAFVLYVLFVDNLRMSDALSPGFHWIFFLLQSTFRGIEQAYLRLRKELHRLYWLCWYYRQT
eukprot:gene7665-9129_t